MAKIISLGCEVAAVHKRYSEVHRVLFGSHHYRLAISSFKEGKERAYGNYQRTLEDLTATLVRLTADIASIGEEEKQVRSAERMYTTLLEYSKVLAEVMACLSGICHKLGSGDKVYRKDVPGGLSPFGRDKVRYDQIRQQLERVGTQITKLFSSY